MPGPGRGLTLRRRAELPAASFHLARGASATAEATRTTLHQAPTATQVGWTHVTSMPKRLRWVRSPPFGRAVTTLNGLNDVCDRSPFSCWPGGPPGRGLGPAQPSLFPSSARRETRHDRAERDDSFQSLQPIGCQVHPMRHRTLGRRLSPAVASPSCRDSGRWEIVVRPRTQNRPPPSRFRRDDPDGRTIGAVLASRCQGIHHEGCPVSRACSKQGLFGPKGSGFLDNRRPILASRAAAGIPVRALETRATPTPTAPTVGKGQPEAPYHRQVSPRWLEAVAPRSRTSRHRALVLPPRGRLPTVLRGASQAPLDIRARWLSPWPVRPLPLAGFCSKMSPEHAIESPDLLVDGGKPPLRRMRLPEGRFSRAFSGQGSDGRTRCVTPTGTTARAGGFTPT